MSLEQIRFSRKLIKEQHVSRLRLHGRKLAFLLTCGEVLVGILCCVRGDYLSTYAIVSYISKEHILARFANHV